MSNMLNCVEQMQIQKYKTHAYKTPKTACVQTIMLKHPTKQYINTYNSSALTIIITEVLMAIITIMIIIITAHLSNA